MVWLILALVFGAPQVEPKCDADIIAQYAGQGELKWLETIEAMEEMGAVDQTYADELRRLIGEYYATVVDAGSERKYIARNCR